VPPAFSTPAYDPRWIREYGTHTDRRVDFTRELTPMRSADGTKIWVSNWSLPPAGAEASGSVFLYGSVWNTGPSGSDAYALRMLDQALRPAHVSAPHWWLISHLGASRYKTGWDDMPQLRNKKKLRNFGGVRPLNLAAQLEYNAWRQH